MRQGDIVTISPDPRRPAERSIRRGERGIVQSMHGWYCIVKVPGLYPVSIPNYRLTAAQSSR